MIDLALILLQTLQVQAPPGVTKFSVTPDTCQAESCDGLKYSSFFSSYVHQETAVEGTARYKEITKALIRSAELETCKSLDPAIDELDDCVPYPAAKGWGLMDLIESSIGVMIPESGLREDVMNGRGSHKHPDDVGGEGRGPAGEACLMQIIPSSIAAFAPGGWSTGPEDLLGGDQEHLQNCIRTGMRMLMKSMAHCDWSTKLEKKLIINGEVIERQYDRHFGMYSMYGTGNSCWASNGTKTSYRTSVYNRAASTIRTLYIKAKAQEKKNVKQPPPVVVPDPPGRQPLAQK